MSRPNNPGDLFPSSDPSGDFAKDEGMVGYAVESGRNPDRTIKDIAERATRVAMIVSGRTDVNVRKSVEVIVEELKSELPDL